MEVSLGLPTPQPHQTNPDKSQFSLDPAWVLLSPYTVIKEMTKSKVSLLSGPQMAN